MKIIYNFYMRIKFAENLRSLREESKLTQQQLADALNTTQRKVSYWESGKIQPDLENLWKIFDFFNVSIDELVGKEPY